MGNRTNRTAQKASSPLLGGYGKTLIERLQSHKLGHDIDAPELHDVPSGLTPTGESLCLVDY